MKLNCGFKTTKNNKNNNKETVKTPLEMLEINRAFKLRVH